MIPLRKELGFAVRRALRSPGFTVVTVLTLALGIGANTAIFSVVHAVLLRPLPYERPEQLYGIWHAGPGIGIDEFEHSETTYTVYRDLNESFIEMGLSDSLFSLNLTGEGEPVRLSAATATASLFRVLGVEPVRGRFFTEEEDDPGAPPVAVLSYELWQGRFGGDPRIVGRTLRLNDEVREVIGVMPAAFDFPSELVQIWIPHVIEPEELGQANFSYDAIGRLKPGVSVEAATAELDRLLWRVPEIHPGELTEGLMRNARMSVHLNPLIEDVVGEQVATILWVLAGTVGFVLAIACANVANLFLVRAEGRQRELALRTALGASRGSLLGHFLTESLLVAGLGGLVGLGIAYGALRGLLALSPDNIPRLGDVGLDPAVLLFAAVVSLVTGVVFGSIPIVRYRLENLAGALNEGSLRASAGRETHRARSALVVAQVAFALVLLVGSVLMARTFWNLRSVEPGFARQGVLTLRLSLPRSAYPESGDAARFYERLLDALSGLPGVTSAGAVSNFPMTDGSSNNAMVLEDFPLATDELPPIVRTNWAMAGYFETVGIPLLEGRTFERRDHERPTGSVIVSESVAREHWPNGSALGRRLVPGLPDEDEEPVWYTIVGVVGDVRDDGLQQPSPPMVYYPAIGFGRSFDDWVLRTMTVTVRTNGEPAALAGASRDAVWSIDPNLPLVGIRSVGEIVADSIAATSYTMILIGIAAGVALVLGSVGIYGVVSYIVGQRTREIGVRMALGARRADVSRMVVLQALALSGIGVALGVFAALAGARVMTSLLYEVGAADPVTFVLVPLFLVGVTALASYLPARRAASTPPVLALRHE